MIAKLSRRSLLQSSGFALGSVLLPPAGHSLPAKRDGVLHLNLNENAFGPSPAVLGAVQRETGRLALYADDQAASALAEQIAAYERVPASQIVLGEILARLGIYLGSSGGAGGEFIYSTPGYLALVQAASLVGGVGVAVPLDATYSNDLPALGARVNPRTRALYLINPHNPTGTVSIDAVFKTFLRDVSQHTLVILDEAYLEYAVDFERRSAVELVRDGANIIVFRTFDKIHGLAGLPIGYAIVPRALGDALRKEGIGDAEGLGRLNIAAANAALVDRGHVAYVRAAVATERDKWHALLTDWKLPHTRSAASFVFFDTGKPQPVVEAALRKQGIAIGRAFPPYNTWVRITIGTPEQNKNVQQRLRTLLSTSTQ